MNKRKTLAILIVLTITASGCTVKIQSSGTQKERPTTVVDVVDGDTVDIRLKNKTETVRLLGVDTPEVHVETQPEDYPKIPDNTRGRSCLREWGEKASNFAKEKLADQEVEFVTDPMSDTRGSYGRLLGYIKVDGDNFNFLLVEKGYASVYDSEFTEKERFLEAEKEAQSQLKGLWQCRSYEVDNLTVKE